MTMTLIESSASPDMRRPGDSPGLGRELISFENDLRRGNEEDR